MRFRKDRKKILAVILAFAMCATTVCHAREGARAAGADAGEGSVAVKGPVIDAEKGKVIWDCVYFGNYWQNEYVTSRENQPQQGEDDVEHEDTDGTKYLVRQDKKCYKYEPVRWRVLSVNEDGTDAFLMAEQNLDIQPYNSTYSETVTWEDSSVRTWLNGDFVNKAFTQEEQKALIETEIENKKNPLAEENSGMEDGANTQDKVYLLSLDEVRNRAYGFIEDLEMTEIRETSNTDFTSSGGTAKADSVFNGYWLRTLGKDKGKTASIDGFGCLSFSSAGDAVDRSVRPVLHLDLTKTDVWSYAGKVKQDKTEIAPDATPAVPTASPAPQPNVTMAPGQVYPKNPVVDGDDVNKNTWDCIYFGTYYNTKFTPAVLSRAGEHDTVQTDEEGKNYLVRHEQGYFQSEPIKWRVLSINEDGTDAFVMADQLVDVAQFYNKSYVEITWEKSDIRVWLNGDFLTTAFTDAEKGKILDTHVETAAHPWTGEAGGNDTVDKVFLPSVDEMLMPSYGFSSDKEEALTRKITATDYVNAGGTPSKQYAGSITYWMRSQAKKGCPSVVGDWGDGTFPENGDKASAYVGVRPVMHVDLSDTASWSYAGQVTPKGVVAPKEDNGSGDTPSPNPNPNQNPTLKPEPTQNPGLTPLPDPTKKPDTTPKVKKPGKPVIKKLKNKAGKKVTVTLSKKVSGATGYQVAYAAKSSMKGQKKKSFKGTSVTVKGLKKKKTYFFKVRAYTKKNGTTAYGNWSKAKSIKVKK